MYEIRRGGSRDVIPEADSNAWLSDGHDGGTLLDSAPPPPNRRAQRRAEARKRPRPRPEPVVRMPPPASSGSRPLPDRKPGTVFRRGLQLSVVIAAVGVALGFFVALSIGLTVIYLGLALFCAANYGAFRVGEETVALGPNLAVMATFGAVGLAVTAFVAGL